MVRDAGHIHLQVFHLVIPSLISYTGDNAKKGSKTVYGTTSDGTYDFYPGDGTVTVSGDLGSVSVYYYHDGYMGGENLVRYSNTCSP